MPDFLTQFEAPIFVAAVFVAWYVVVSVILRGGDRRRVRRFERVAKQLGLESNFDHGCSLHGSLDGMRVKVSWKRRELPGGNYDHGEANFRSGTLFKAYFPEPLDMRSTAMTESIRVAKQRHKGLRVSADGIAISSSRLASSVGGMIQTLRRLAKAAKELEESSVRGAVAPD